MTQTLGWVATILFTVCYIPQIARILKAKTVDGVSATFFGIQLLANFVALGYALRLGQWPLEVKYVLGIVFVIAVLLVYYQTKK